MLQILTTAAIREIEALAVNEGIPESEMMTRAGTALARRAAAYLRSLPAAIEQARVTCLIGPGKNGGDGLVAGRVLAENTNALVRFYLVRKRPDDDPLMQPIVDAGHLVVVAEDDLRYRVLTQLVASADLVIDALYGIGTTPPLRPEASKLLRAAAQALREKPEPPPTWVIEPEHAPQPTPRPFILACDCPSGMNADTGEHDANTVHVNETVTFIAPKPGLLRFPGAAAVGRLTVAPLGIPPSLKPFKETKTFLVDADYVSARLPPRPADSHKGSFGKTLVIGGSMNYLGAPALAALAAYRSGAGLVTVASIADVSVAHAGRLTEATWVILPGEDGVIAQDAARVITDEMAGVASLVLGPGLGTQQPTFEFLTTLLQQHSAKPGVPRTIGFQPVLPPSPPAEAVTRQFPPLVIDADALNLLAKLDKWYTLLPESTILTPHPGEMARLCGTETSDVQNNRVDLAREKAKLWKCVVLLKGAHTVIASPDGRIALLPFKTSALAKAGTGDVLAGMCGGFLGQGMKAFDAAVCAAYLHGFAGTLAEAAVGTARSVIASEVVDHIQAALAALEGAS